jgi:hypothetical protein
VKNIFFVFWIIIDILSIVYTFGYTTPGTYSARCAIIFFLGWFMSFFVFLFRKDIMYIPKDFWNWITTDDT